MNIIMERAAAQDLDAVSALYGAVCDYLADKPFNPGWRRDIFPAREDAIQYLNADGLCIARAGGEIVGSISLTPDADGVPCIHEAAVHPEHLREGVGTAMLDFAAKRAAELGAETLRLYVWEGNTPAIRAYEKSGFVCLGKKDIGLSEFGLEWFYLYEKPLGE